MATFGAGGTQEKGREQGFNVGGPRGGGVGITNTRDGTGGRKPKTGDRSSTTGKAKQTQGTDSDNNMGFMAREATIAAAIEEAAREEGDAHND